MEPKLYLLFALFSIILAVASQENLREYLRKLRIARPGKSSVQRQA